MPFSIRDVYKKYSFIPKYEMDIFLQFLLKIDKTGLFLENHLKLSCLQTLKLKSLIKKRLKHVPVAYLIKSQHFHGLDFFVSKNVLIPRPETEQMVEIALNLDAQNILDIATGSGCIACTLAHKNPNASITALDISRSALKVAKKNAKKLKLKNLNIIHSDFLNNIPKNSNFDLIITNPPYIKDSDSDIVSMETQLFEPHLALFSGKDGLDAYRTIFKQLKEKNITFKYFLGEVGFNQTEEITALLELHFSGKYTLIKDFAGITRFIKITN